MNKKFMVFAILVVMVISVVLIIKFNKSETGIEGVDYTQNDGFNSKEYFIESQPQNNKDMEDCLTVRQEEETEQDNDPITGEHIQEENDTKTENIQEEEDASGSEAKEKDIESVPLNIVDMDEQTKSSIGDYGKFLFSIKKFFYENGIVAEDVVCMNEIEQVDDMTKVMMKVDSHIMNYFYVVEENEEYYVVPF